MQDVSLSPQKDEPVPVPSSTAAAPSTAAAAPLPNNDAPESAAEEEDLTWAASAALSPAAYKNEDTVGLLASKDEPSTAAAGTAEQQAPQLGPCSCFSLEFYKPLFDVDTEDVTSRILRSCYPFTEHSFFEIVGDKPDLYGPFWICATLVFVVGVTSNMSTWLNIGDANSRAWHYDFTLMTASAAFIFSFAAIMPFLIWLTLAYLKVPLTFIKVTCLYGYSIVLFIPAAVLCLTPSAVVDWIAISVAAVASSGLLLVNSYPLVAEHAGPSARTVAVSMGAVQMLFGLILKLYFFQRVE